MSPPSPPRRESPSPLDLNNLACSDKGDAESDQLRDCAEDIVPLYDPSHSEKANEPDLAGVSYDLGEEFSIAPEQPGREATLSELHSE